MYNYICLDGNHIHQLIARYWVAVYCLAGELYSGTGWRILQGHLRWWFFHWGSSIGGFPTMDDTGGYHIFVFPTWSFSVRTIHDSATSGITQPKQEKSHVGQQSAHSPVVLLRFFLLAFFIPGSFNERIWARICGCLGFRIFFIIFSPKWAPMTNVDHEQKLA